MRSFWKGGGDRRRCLVLSRQLESGKAIDERIVAKAKILVAGKESRFFEQRTGRDSFETCPDHAKIPSEAG